MPQKNQVRIIGGRWRGRKLPFADVPGLRPTSDRIRETLFNWLMSHTPNANCLDLFSGSGALGFEALSRGAAWVSFVDSNSHVVKQLKENTKILDAENTEVFRSDLPTKLPFTKTQYDLVFMDPPFEKGLVEPCCQWLAQEDLLKSDAMIYLETERSLKNLSLPESWELHREKKAGRVRSCLYVNRK